MSFSQFYIHYVGQNSNARYLNLKGTMILANLFANTKDCHVFVVAIDPSQFSSITFDSKLQFDVSPLLRFRPGSLSESFKGDSLWHNTSHEGHAFNTRRKREGCIRMEVAPLRSSYTNSSLFPRILTCSSCTTPPEHCHPLFLFIRSRVATKELC